MKNSKKEKKNNPSNDMRKKIYKIISGYAFESMTEEEINKTVDKIIKVFNERKDEAYWKGYDRAMKVMSRQQTVDGD